MTDASIERPEYELTNEHRPYFGLQPVSPEWKVRFVESELYPNLKVYFLDDRIFKYVKFNGDPRSMHYFEADVDLATDDEGETWFRPVKKTKPKPVTQSGMPRPKGLHVYWNCSSGEGSGRLVCEHARNKRVLVDSGRVVTSPPRYMLDWIDAFVRDAGDGHWQRLEAVQSASRTRPEPWRPGDYIKIEAAQNSWVYARVQVPVQYLNREGLIGGFEEDPAHSWMYLAASLWWGHVLDISPDEDAPSFEQLESADRLPGGFIEHPYHDDGRTTVVGHSAVQAQELNLPETIKGHRGNYSYDWGLVHLYIEHGPDLDDVSFPGADSVRSSLPWYDLSSVEAVLRGEIECNRPSCFGTNVPPPSYEERAALLRQLGLSEDIDYDTLCAHQNVPDREELAKILNDVPEEGLTPERY